MININRLYYALQTIRRPESDLPTFSPSISTSISSILGSDTKNGKIIGGSTNVKPINTRQMSGYYMVLPEYFNEYVLSIQEKTESNYVDLANTVFTTDYGIPSEVKQTANAEIIKQATGLEYVYDGTEKWVTQKDLIDCFLTRNNYIKHAVRPYNAPLLNNEVYGDVYWESTAITKIKEYINGEYVETTYTRNDSGNFGLFGMEGVFSEAVPRRTKQVRYNSSLDEYYLYSHVLRTVKLKLVLSDGTDNINFSGIDFIDKVKCVYDIIYNDENGQNIRAYDNNHIELINGQFVDLPAIPDFNVPLDDTYYYYKEGNPNRTIWTYKEFDNYQDVVDLVMQ